ncbi:hypothetical protein [uncultured Thiocystis sp.]|jgi:hypothetical protein|uniref:hypothetical protein n=1 Tax=uncultured Thiocystis sp. TaxID=1202134 RepID=UPI0025FDC417|nr:hypothetical protein [uncultured Thiocystis sp.]
MTADPQTSDATAKSDYDSPWKEALDRFFPEFLALLFPAIHAQIDWRAPPVFLDKELQQIGGDSPRGRRHADKLARARARDGREIWVLIHVEVRGDPESGFGERMFVYQSRLRDRYGLDVVSLAVLTDTTANFRPSQFRHARWGCGIAFRFPMVKLLDDLAPERWAELEASDNVFALVVMAQIRAKVTEEAETLKGWKFRLIRLMYERGYERALILELFRLIDWMIRLPAGLEADFRQQLYAYEEQHHMPYVTTVEQAGIQRGEANILLRQFSCKFGPDSAEIYRSRIESAEPKQLEEWSERILTAETPETIFH